MPYVDKETRQALRGRNPVSAGELNYEITRLLTAKNLSGIRLLTAVQTLMDLYVETEPGLTYQRANDVMGAVYGALSEYTRRKGSPHPFESLIFMTLQDFYKDVIGPYEDTKIAKNGDVDGYGVGRRVERYE